MILRIFTFPGFRVLLICSMLAALAACSKKETTSQVTPPQEVAPLQLSFTNTMGNLPLRRNDTVYTNTAGEAFTVKRFRYYISNFQLLSGNDSVTTLPLAYFIVDDANDSSRLVTLDSVPIGTYNGIRFLIGVDSLHNMSGAQTGALAPENGLFWSWNSGYIMAQMEGNSPVINSPTHEFLFHIGGFKGPYNALRTAALAFPQPVIVATGKQPKVNIQADAGKWFHTPFTVSFKNAAVIMAPGPDAVQISANYQQMFSVKAITN
ncbi:MbnP family protein [Chitinophaga vietnamensis]|uniref:MbnP family protein n=1 Tax=Chitinophaga vietnamensis TaxID=2593957 RepID=UPI0011785C57|nr:MbnP family protein [Chitinophaga vietnamensis]